MSTKKPSLHKNWIDYHALGIVKALQKEKHTTYLVGGCVRDLLLGIHPKDFDIATTALPNQVKKIIRFAYVIGKRFRLVLVKREDKQFEVSTFRREVKPEEIDNEDLPAGDNFFGTPEEDANRRDFTINGLFYDPIKDELIDFTNGIEDLNDSIVRMIGDPVVRLKEDPIRILRGIRLAHMVNFSIDPKLRRAMKETAPLIALTALPRRREEFLKILRLPNPIQALLELYDLDVLSYLSPTISKILDNKEFSDSFLQKIASYHDSTIDKKNPIELFGVFVFSYLSTLYDDLVEHRNWEENEDLQKLMRDELGMFRHEQIFILKAIGLLYPLTQREHYLKKGFRRQQAVIKQPSFPLALLFAYHDKLVSPNDWHFWFKNYLQIKK